MPTRDVDKLEKIGHFYHRGAETTRLETFVDAAFAFALTLLVISFDAVPASFDELVIALRSTPAFLFGFMILMMFWVAHRNWSKRFGLDTTFASLVSLALVFIILVYVYPLRAMATAAISAITNGWIPTSFEITTLSQVRGLFAIYGSGFVLCTASLVLLNLHALSLRDRLSLSAEEVFLTKSEIGAWLIVGGIGLLSILMAYLLPPRYIGASGWIYASLAILMPSYHWLTNRQFTRQFGRSAAAAAAAAPLGQ